MSIKFNAPELGTKKPFFVDQSNDNMLATFNFQLAAAEAGDTQGLSPVDQIKAMKKLTEETIQYIENTLDLTDKQDKLLHKLDYQDTTKLATRLGLQVQGLSEKEARESLEDDSNQETEK